MTTSTPRDRNCGVPRAWGARMLAIALPALLVAGCAGTKPLAYSGIASTRHMQANPRSDRLPYAYAAQVDWRRYNRIIVEPVQVYEGPDSQFGKMSDQYRQDLADYMEERFTARLAARFIVVDRPQPRTLRLRLTLTGAKTTTAVAGSLSRIDLAGAPYNMVQAVRGKEGSMTGSVFYAVEVYDADTDRLLMAQIVKQYPAALNIKATFGALNAAKTGIVRGADQLAKQLDGSDPSPSRARSSSDEVGAIYDPEATPQTKVRAQPVVYPVCGGGRVDGCRQRGGR